MIATISIGVDPEVQLGPVTIAWHGATIAVGILMGLALARREARRRGIDPEPLSTIGVILVIAGLVGGRAFFLAQHGGLGDPEAWLGSRGFTFYGGFLLVAVGVFLYARWRRLNAAYVDLVALGFPLGYAVGRIGDIINGEHYGPATTFFLGVRNTHPEAEVPSNALAYHSGGLYEALIGLTVFAVAWLVRDRLRTGGMVCLVVGLLATGRFFEFFIRSDSATAALGLETAQWVSLALMVAAALGVLLSGRLDAKRTGAEGPALAEPSPGRR
jgi:phosphatidylglycerol:prolipoprotein diacylglycerol transferase